MAAMALCGIAGIIEGSMNILLFSLLCYSAGIIFLKTCIDREEGEGEFINKIFTYGYIIRIVSSLAFYYILMETRGEPFLGGGDDEEYEIWGRILSDNWMAGNFELPRQIRNYPGYPYVNGALHFFANFTGGYHILVSRILNAFFGALIAVYVFKIANKVYDLKTAKASGWLAVLLPDLIYFSSVQLKDIIISFLFSVFVFYLIQYNGTGKKRNLLMALLAGVSVYYFRYQYAFVLLGICFASLFIFLFKNKGRVMEALFKNAYILAIMIAVSIFVVKDSERYNPSSKSFVIQMEEGRWHGFGQFVERKEKSDSLALSLYEKVPPPLSYIVFPLLMLIMPYPPWVALFYEVPIKAMKALNGFIWFALVPFSFIGIIFTLRRKAVSSFPVYSSIISLLVISGASSFNDRYRLPVVPLILILMVYGMRRLTEYSWAKVYYIEVQLIILIAYVIKKYHLLSMQSLVLIFMAVGLYMAYAFKRKLAV
jgi:hypothetical protein